jgi:hypothetical protein
MASSNHTGGIGGTKVASICLTKRYRPEEKQMMRRTFFSIAGVLLLSACGGIINIGGGGQSRSYDISTNRDNYNRGNVGEATIRNASDQTLEYNLCQRRLERQVDRSWITAFEWPTAGGACTSEARRLSRGQSVDTFFDIPTGMPAGTYRIMFLGLIGEDGNRISGDRAASPSFTVR